MPDVREKLVELRKEAAHYAICTCSAFQHCEDCPYRKYGTDCRDNIEMDYLLKKGVTVQEWISTDEKMPTEDDATDGYVAAVYDWGDGVKTKTISLVDVVIAHPDLYDYWMPLNLPQPPKGDHDENNL